MRRDLKTTESQWHRDALLNLAAGVAEEGVRKQAAIWFDYRTQSAQLDAMRVFHNDPLMHVMIGPGACPVSNGRHLRQQEELTAGRVRNALEAVRATPEHRQAAERGVERAISDFRTRGMAAVPADVAREAAERRQQMRHMMKELKLHALSLAKPQTT